MADETETEQVEAAAAKAAQDAADAKAAAAPEEGEEFDKDRALATIKKQRESEDAAKKRATELEAELKRFKDRDLTEQEKAANKTAEAEGRATTAEKAALQLDVALDKAPEGMPIAQIRKLAKRLAGSDREEFEADAEELFAEFAPKEEPTDTRRRPQERLRPGSVPNVAATTDMNDFIRAGSKRT